MSVSGVSTFLLLSMSRLSLFKNMAPANWCSLDHCIEALRASIICHGDTSLFTFAWLDGIEGQVTETRDDAYHQCVNYDALMGWIHERAVDLFDPNLLAMSQQSDSNS
jgi:hypothetical protein